MKVKSKFGVRQGSFRPPTKQNSTNAPLTVSNADRFENKKTENHGNTKYYNVMWWVCNLHVCVYYVFINHL